MTTKKVSPDLALPENEKDVSVPVENKSEITEIEEQEIIVPASFSDRVNEWLLRVNNSDYTPKMYIYRYDNSGDAKTLMNRFDIENPSEMPDEHTIGMMFGSGKYIVVVHSRNEKNEVKGRSFSFKIGRYYDEQRKQQAMFGAPINPYQQIPFYKPEQTPPVQVESVNVQNQIADQFKMMLECIKTLTPMIQGGNRGESHGEILKNQVGMYDMMQGILKKSLYETQGLIAEMQRKQIDGGNQNNEIPVQNAEIPEQGLQKFLGLIQPFIPVIQKLLPSILGQAGNVSPTSQVSQGTAFNIPLKE